jgi:uncharacterized protein YjbI with pentapeptide repeats
MSKDFEPDLLQERKNRNKYWQEWAGSLWNWLQFPLLALLLVVGCIWLNVQQRQNYLALSRQQQQIAADQQRDQLLTSYINSISDLLLYDDLLHAKPSDVKKLVIDARTKETLRALDPSRKASLMRFLYQTRLINNDVHVIDMAEADLHGTTMSGIDLRDTYLVGANMSGADLRNANLTFATLVFTNLSGANLTSANLQASDMHNTDVRGANLAGANLKDVIGITNAQLAKAKSLAGAIMPDGSKHS